jgi:hypothetical protein
MWVFVQIPTENDSEESMSNDKMVLVPLETETLGSYSLILVEGVEECLYVRNCPIQLGLPNVDFIVGQYQLLRGGQPG